MALGGEGLWCGASLRPWQILHSRLARMHTCALLERDVWELIDETVEAACRTASEYKKEELQIWDGDDGELWRHGGVMESRIRDWLTSQIQEHPQEAPIILHPYRSDQCTSPTSRSELRETRDSRLQEQVAGNVFSEADLEGGDGEGANAVDAPWSSEFGDDWDSAYLEEVVYGAVVDALNSGAYNEEEEIKEEIQGSIGVNNTANAAVSAAPLDAETHCCHSIEDWQANYEGGEERKLLEDELLCAVCLEKLYVNGELQRPRITTVTRLPCCHAFHSECVSPWVSTSARCPCCRAAIPLSWRLQLEVPLNLGVAGSGHASCSDRVQVDMMGLVAEVEAALDRIGLLA